MKDVNILTNNGINVSKSLELFGDMKTYDEMLKEFLAEVGNKFSEAKMYKESGDMANYAIIVHSLKSDFRYFGIDSVADMFYEHELAGKKNDMSFVTANFDKLMTEAHRMVDVLTLYMNGSETLASAIATEIDESKETIIVVDDSTIVRNFIERIFKDKYNIRLSSDGKEAIDIIASSNRDKIACMFLDLNMPNVDGFQVLEYFKTNDLFKKIPVSIITGSDDRVVIERAFTYPIVDILQKPFNDYALEAFARKTIGQKK